VEGCPAVSGAISNLSRTSKNAYFMGGLFDIFGAFLNIWVSFDPFFGVDFPTLGTFWSSVYGILARRTLGRCIAHPRTVLRQALCPQPLSKITILGTPVNLGCTLFARILHSSSSPSGTSWNILVQPEVPGDGTSRPSELQFLQARWDMLLQGAPSAS
jgi:hypothetical protein